MSFWTILWGLLFACSLLLFMLIVNPPDPKPKPTPKPVSINYHAPEQARVVQETVQKCQEFKHRTLRGNQPVECTVIWCAQFEGLGNLHYGAAGAGGPAVLFCDPITPTTGG